MRTGVVGESRILSSKHLEEGLKAMATSGDLVKDQNPHLNTFYHKSMKPHCTMGILRLFSPHVL